LDYPESSRAAAPWAGDETSVIAPLAMNSPVAPPAERRFQIDALDGVRGLAVLLVFLSHCSNKGVSLVPYTDFGGMGKTGVWLFFLLSSFLLTYPFIAKGKDSFTRQSLANYAWRRVLRVYPLYILYCLLALVTTPFISHLIPPDTVTTSGQEPGIPFLLTPWEFVQHLLLLQGKGLTWSILVEFKFYFVLPVLAVCFVLLFKRNLWLSAALTAAGVALAAYFWPDSNTNDPRLGPYLPIFLIGSFLALLHWHSHDQKWLQTREAQIGLEVAGWCSLAVLTALIPSVASFFSGQEIPNNAFHKQFLLFCSLWAIVLVATIHGYGGLRALFANNVLRFFGFISFSFYLLHVIVLNAMNTIYHKLVDSSGLSPTVEQFVTNPLLGWSILAVTTLVSYVSYRLIEKPLASLRLQGSKPKPKSKPEPMPVAEVPT
jgi:peptidoglycan/LPS O-acetylase OafA/YrhL